MLRTCRSSLETRPQTIIIGMVSGYTGGPSLASRVYSIGDGAGAECVASTPL